MILKETDAHGSALTVMKTVRRSAVLVYAINPFQDAGSLAGHCLICNIYIMPCCYMPICLLALRLYACLFTFLISAALFCCIYPTYCGYSDSDSLSFVLFLIK